ncbi:MAG: OmpA family protein [Pseudobdellovibrionaceae bacterium]|nr:OmpA family protein [Pseudobdellovibrionaceae bacterium]
MRLKPPSVALLLFTLGFGCVSASEHAQLERRLSATQAKLNQVQTELDRLQSERDRLRKHLDTSSDQMDQLNSAVHTLDGKQKASRAELESARAANRQLAESLEEKNKALAEAGRARDEQQKMFAAYRDRLKALIASKDLTLSLVDGKLVVSLPSDILFPSGSAKISDRGDSTLIELGTVLQSVAGKRVQVEGHTDNVPIRGGRYASNWHLGYARAMAVVDILVRAGVPAAQLSAASYGEHQPKEPNSDDVSRQKNRRIEIVVVPNLGVLSKDDSWTDGALLSH